MDGWRLGYAAGNGHLLEPVFRVHQYTTSCVNTFAQYGAVEAYRGPQSSVDRMVVELDRKRHTLVGGLNAIPGVECAPPLGAFYVFARFSGFGMDSMGLALYLLREAGVACVAGSAFGGRGEGHIRMAYVASCSAIERALDRMGPALATLATLPA